MRMPVSVSGALALALIEDWHPETAQVAELAASLLRSVDPNKLLELLPSDVPPLIRIYRRRVAIDSGVIGDRDLGHERKTLMFRLLPVGARGRPHERAKVHAQEIPGRELAAFLSHVHGAQLTRPRVRVFELESMEVRRRLNAEEEFRMAIAEYPVPAPRRTLAF